jgi:hypothetical protein
MNLMQTLGYLLVFIVGGSFGFSLACIIASNRVSSLLRENYRLRKELDNFEYTVEGTSEKSKAEAA